MWSDGLWQVPASECSVGREGQNGSPTWDFAAIPRRAGEAEWLEAGSAAAKVHWAVV